GGGGVRGGGAWGELGRLGGGGAPPGAGGPGQGERWSWPIATPVPTATGTRAAGSVLGRAPASQSCAVAMPGLAAGTAGTEPAEVADRPGGGRGGQRRVDPQRLAHRALAVGPAVPAEGGQPRVPARGKLAVRHVKAQLAGRDVDLDAVAVPRERDHAARRRLRRDVADRQAGRAAGEPAVGDQRAGPAQALALEEAGRVQHLLHAGAAAGALVPDDHHVTRLDLAAPT